jgi:plastocyanin
MVPPMKRVSVLVAAAGLTIPLVLGACGGGSGSSNATASSSADLQVVGLDIRYDKKAYDLTAGLRTIELKNRGSQFHTLLIEQNGQRVGDFKLAAQAKKSASGKIDPAAGTYTIYCDVTGHRAAGMEATVTVK